MPITPTTLATRLQPARTLDPLDAHRSNDVAADELEPRDAFAGLGSGTRQRDPEAEAGADDTAPDLYRRLLADDISLEPAPAPREVSGMERPFRGFRETDERALRDLLPANAKHLARTFIDAGRAHDLDPAVLVAISKHETGNFTSSAFRNKHNAMGISNAHGPVVQPSAEASITKMARILASPTGPYRNARTIEQLGNIYAPVGAGNDPRHLNRSWPAGVARFADDVAARSRAGGAHAPVEAQPVAQAPESPAATSCGPEGSCRIERVTHEGERRQMIEGTVTVNGHAYRFRSGGHGRGSLPRGTYVVRRHMDHRNTRGMVVDGVGYSFALTDKWDARVGATRGLLRIHPDGGGAGTSGCVGIVGNGDVQRRFRDDMLAAIRRGGGRAVLRVG